MRIALLSDIHGNFTALEAVLADLEKNAVDRVICLGDVATLGPQPRQCFETVSNLGWDIIMGNHDEAMMNLDQMENLNIAAQLSDAMHWCVDQFSADELAGFSNYKDYLSIPLDDEHNLVCYHGSPDSNIDNILPNTPSVDLDLHLFDHKAMFYAGGHTHVQMVRSYLGTWIINPGSIGAAFKRAPMGGNPPVLLPWAEYAILNFEKDMFNVEVKRAHYDVAALVDVFKQTDIPVKDRLMGQYAVMLA